MGIFKKKVMYTSIPTDGDEERSSYFGESSLAGDESIGNKAAASGFCKLTIFKGVIFVLLCGTIFSGMGCCRIRFHSRKFPSLGNSPYFFYLGCKH